MKGKLAGQRTKTCKKARKKCKPLPFPPSASGSAAGETGEERCAQKGSGLQPLLLKIKPVKEVKANAPGGGATGQVGKAFKCTIFCGPQLGGWPGDIAPQAQGERHHEQSGGKSRQRWSEQPFLTLSDRNVRSSLYISHIGRFGATNGGGFDEAESLGRQR